MNVLIILSHTHILLTVLCISKGIAGTDSKLPLIIICLHRVVLRMGCKDPGKMFCCTHFTNLVPAAVLSMYRLTVFCGDNARE